MAEDAHRPMHNIALYIVSLS